MADSGGGRRRRTAAADGISGGGERRRWRRTTVTAAVLYLSGLVTCGSIAERAIYLLVWRDIIFYRAPFGEGGEGLFL